MRAPARAAAWAAWEEAARTLAPDVAALQLETPADGPPVCSAPACAALVARLVALERAAGPKWHLWMWAVRAGTVVHVTDAADFGAEPGERRTQAAGFDRPAGTPQSSATV